MAWWLTSKFKAHRSMSVGIAATAVATVVLLATVATSKPTEQSSPRTSPHVEHPTTSATLAPTDRTIGPPTVQGEPLSSGPAGFAAAAGQPVTAQGAKVDAVPVDEGLWIAAEDGGRIWVQIVETNGESPERIVPGALVSFEGQVVAHDGQFPASVGLTASDGAGDLSSQAGHIEVSVNALRVEP